MMVTTPRFLLGTGGALAMLAAIALNGVPERGLAIDRSDEVVDRPSAAVQLRRADARKARRDARTAMASSHTGAVTDAPMVAASHAAHHARHARRVTLIDQRSGSGIDLDRQEPVLGATIRRAVRDDRGG